MTSASLQHPHPLSSAREPIRKRAQERFEHILNSTEALLSERDEEDVSLAQIAARAELPLTSVYNFFPNRNAAFVALAQRFHRELRYLASRPHATPPTTWQQMVAMNQVRNASYLNERPASLRLFLGAGVSVQVRNADMRGNADLVRTRLEIYKRTFDMPNVPDFESRMAISVALTDGIWALSYSNFRCIAHEYIEESIRAAVGYLRNFLPEIVPLR